MKIKYVEETSPLELTHGKIYDVISIEKGLMALEAFLLPLKA